jgi:hypothetical protein
MAVVPTSRHPRHFATASSDAASTVFSPLVAPWLPLTVYVSKRGSTNAAFEAESELYVTPYVFVMTTLTISVASPARRKTSR